MKVLLILTGWTRGLGEGILRAYTDVYGKDLSVIGIARSGNSALAGAVRKAGCALRCISGNLAEADDTDRIIRELESCQVELLEECGSSGAGACPEQSILINNAAIIGPIETLPTVENSRRFYDEAQSTFALNCIAPALLSGWFLSHCAGSSRNLIINISSGASQGAMNGAGIYSMTKIALNMLGRILVSEQEEPGQKQSQRAGVKILSISPGMVETQMQETLRESRKFPNAEYFREAARNGTVRSNVLVGKMIAELDFDRLENGSYHHIQDLIESDGV